MKEEKPLPETFAEVCAPIAQAVAASGMTEEELDQLVQEAREEVWQEQHAEQMAARELPTHPKPDK